MRGRCKFLWSVLFRNVLNRTFSWYSPGNFYLSYSYQYYMIHDTIKNILIQFYPSLQFACTFLCCLPCCLLFQREILLGQRLWCSPRSDTGLVNRLSLLWTATGSEVLGPPLPKELDVLLLLSRREGRRRYYYMELCRPDMCHNLKADAADKNIHCTRITFFSLWKRFLIVLRWRRVFNCLISWMVLVSALTF